LRQQLATCEARVWEEAAKIRPSRSTMKRPPGDWYECGWNDAVVAMSDTIKAHASRQGKEQP
jgi:hypothetical protein